MGKFMMAPPVMAPEPFKVFCKLCDIIAFLTSSTVETSSLQDFHDFMVKALYEFEYTFPQTEHAIVFHLLFEIFFSVKRLGPTFTYWMYPFERAVGAFSRKLHDRAQPEANLMTILATETALERIAARFPEDLFADVPAHLVPPACSQLDVTECNTPLFSFSTIRGPRTDTSIQVTPDVLADITSALSQHDQLQPGDVKCYTKGVRVRSSMSGKAEKRWTTKGQQSRNVYVKSSRLYSFLCGSTGTQREFVGCVDYFCVVRPSACIRPTAYLAYASVYRVQHDQFGLPYFEPSEASMEFVNCDRFGGLIGVGSHVASPHWRFIFP